jgi:hypothetical protein
LTDGAGLWDLQTFAKLEALHNLPRQYGIYPEHLEMWINRAPVLVDMIEQLFPRVPMFWRMLHYVHVSFRSILSQASD